MNIWCQELTITWPYSLKSLLIANQYFSEIRYVRRVLSHRIQTVVCSAFHGILAWIFCLHVDSKNASYLSRLLVRRSSCNRPFGGVRALRAFTGLAAPRELPTPRTWPGTPLQPTTAVSPSVLWEQEGVVVRDHLSFSSLCEIVSA